MSGQSITDTDNSGRKLPDSGVEDRHPDQSLENAERENTVTAKHRRGCHDRSRIVVLSLEMGKNSGKRLATQEKEAHHKAKEVQEGQQSGALRVRGALVQLPSFPTVEL